MLIVLIKRIESAGTDREGLTGFHVHHFASAGNAIIRFEMVLVVKPLLGSLLDDRVMKGKAHAVGLQQNPPAFPSSARNMARSADNFIKGSDDHGLSSLLSVDFRGRVFRVERSYLETMRSIPN